MDNNEKHADNPEPGNVWNLDGNPKVIVLSVGKETIEYCDKKIHYGPGIWEWDLESYQVMRKKSFKRYLCAEVSLDEEPSEFKMQFDPIECSLHSVRVHYKRMNREFKEGPEMLSIEKDGLTLTFERGGDGEAILSDGENKIGLNIFTLWAIGDEAYEQGDL